MYKLFEVGCQYPEYAARDDTVHMSLSESGLFLPVSLVGVSPDDLAYFSAQAPFEMRFAVLRNVIFFLFKFGAMEWMDTPYYPFSQVVVSDPDTTQGLSLHCALFDGHDGRLLAQRMIGCGHRFTVSLLKALADTDRAGLTLAEYDAAVSAVYAAYPTRSLLQMATANFKLR